MIDCTQASDCHAPLFPRGIASFSPDRKRRGFSLVEAIVSISIMALAGSVLMLAAQTSLDVADEAVQGAIAQGIVEQFLDEVQSKRYMESGSAYNRNSLGSESGETSRLLYDDTDDFHDYVVQPPLDTWSQPLGAGDDAGGQRHPNFKVAGNYFQNWRLRAAVYYVNDADFTQRLDNPVRAAGQTLTSTSGSRGVEAIVEYIDADGTVRTLAKGRRIYAYIPAPP